MEELNLLSKITETTLVPVSMFAIILSACAAGSWWLSALYARVAKAEDNIVELQASQREIIEELKDVNINLVEIKTVLKGSLK